MCYRFSFSCLFFFTISPIGLYGLQRGIVSTPSSKFKVKLNSVLNHSGRYGSRVGNTLGVFAVLYSLYEGLGDTVSVHTIDMLYYTLSIEYLFLLLQNQNTLVVIVVFLMQPIK